MRIFAILPLLALAACSANSPDQINESNAAVVNLTGPSAAFPPPPAASPTPAPATTPAAAPGTTLPPVGAEPRYVGRWAANAGLCAGGAWVFRAKRLDTAGEVSCTFDAVKKVSGGYDIDATCTAEAPPKPDHITLRFAQSAKAMLVHSSMWDRGLIYCGPVE